LNILDIYLLQQEEAPREKNILIPWSGGFDSTALVLGNLLKGNKVSVYRVNIENNELQNKTEEVAFEKMFNLLSKKFENSLFRLEDPLFRVTGKFGKYYLPQAIPLIVGAVFMSSCHYDEIQMAYIMNDDAISFEEEIKSLFASFQVLISEKLPPLVFPLKKVNKKCIIEFLRFESIGRKLIDYISFCEHPHDNLKPCGMCTKCKKMKETVLFERFFPEEYEKKAVLAEKLFPEDHEEKVEAKNTPTVMAVAND
jgi:hypothetical protein